MAFLARIATTGAEPIELVSEPATRAAAPRFSDLEWSVIRLAQVDRPWTIRPVGRLRRWWNRLIGQPNPQLANPRLEALRKIAVLSWRFGFTVGGDDVRDFLAAGFTIDQYELLVTTVREQATTPARRFPAEVLA